MRIPILAVTLLLATWMFTSLRIAVAAEPLYQAENIFMPQSLHTHGSCIVECANGDLLCCWYKGSGERRADDVGVYGARRRRGDKTWSEPFVMADTPGFPDTSPCSSIPAASCG
jgi:hypothetical protein